MLIPTATLTTAADFFDVQKRYPEMQQLFGNFDEADVLFSRVWSAQSPHERAALLGLWNVGPQEKKTGMLRLTPEQIMHAIAHPCRLSLRRYHDEGGDAGGAVPDVEASSRW